MSVDLRTASRIHEFFHIPIQPSVDALRDIYVEVSKSCGYENFLRTGDGARIESVPGEGGGRSIVDFRKDRISFRDEEMSGGLEHFLRRIEATLKAAVPKLRIPLFIARNVTYRAIAPIPRGSHSSQFLAESMFAFEPKDFAAFGRPAQVVGLRLQFPPRDPARECFHQVRIETYLRDPRSLFIEDWATFKMPAQASEWSRIAAEGREVETFMNDQIGQFLEQFGE